VGNNPVNAIDPHGEFFVLPLAPVLFYTALGLAAYYVIKNSIEHPIVPWPDISFPMERGKVIPFPGARAKPKRWEPIPDAATDKHEHCLFFYVLCQETTPSAPCAVCMGFCETQGYWDQVRCPVCPDPKGD